MINHISELYGRQIKLSDLSEELQHHPDIHVRPALAKIAGRWVCTRCQAKLKPTLAGLPSGQFYCYECIQMGRMDTLQGLATVDEPNRFAAVKHPMSWRGHLTALQAACAQQIVEVFKDHRRHLLWAVTGAGKTEMLFPTIEWAIRHGLRIGIASPRVDVCIELFPRIQAAFDGVSSVLLHGKSEAPYQYCQITVCTTHQLLRFYHAFDVMVIDEVDVFPFSGNPMLHTAVSNAIKPSGGLLYLTATPDRSLLRAVKSGDLSVGYLPIRYHGHLLPEVTIIKLPKIVAQIKESRLPGQVMTMIGRLVAAKQRFLLFVPTIQDLQRVGAAISREKIRCRYETVFSADPKRLEKVAAMRSRSLDFLITTTILERGVTFPGIDVLVLKADDRIFSSAALVQIAGRVGRNSERPGGQVLLYCSTRSSSVKACDRQIKQMNQKARQLS